MQILVYHCGALGDFISLLPLFSFLKKKHACTITLLGRPSYGILAIKNKDIDTIVDAESSVCTYIFTPNPDMQKASSFFSRFDRMYLFTDVQSPLVANARTFSSAYIQIHIPFATGNKHIIDYNLEAVTNEDATATENIPDLSAAIDGLHHAGAVGTTIASLTQKPVVAFHPGSGSPLKNWPFHSFLEVADQVRARDFRIAWLTGPAESLHQYPSTDLQFHNVSLSECAVVLSRCRVYCGNDSGITHLAAAVGCPTVALYGPSDPNIWAPRGRNRVHCIFHPEPCTPCHLRKSVSCQRMCLQHITVDEVVNAIVLQLGTS